MMDEKTFQEKLDELARDIDGLPSDEQSKLKSLADQAKERHAKMKRTINDLTESLDYLRLSVKYLVFDLEATRRENRYLRSLLDSTNKNQGNNDNPNNE